MEVNTSSHNGHVSINLNLENHKLLKNPENVKASDTIKTTSLIYHNLSLAIAASQVFSSLFPVVTVDPIKVIR
jgi:hypothetical protein